jgi:Uma2 family endonuclease
MASLKLRIGPADHGRKMTLDEFREAEEEPGYLYELARGVLEATEVPNDPHWQIVSNLQGLFHRHKSTHPGAILRIGGGGECRVWVPGMISGRNPDVAVVLAGTLHDDRGRQPPSLVAEVVSTEGEDRDYRDKRADYLVFGLSEYWIVDPPLRQVTVLVRREAPDGPEWTERLVAGEDVIPCTLLPGFAGRVSELWVDLP